MAQVATGFFQQLFEVFHRLFGLSAGIAQPDQIACKIGTDLAAHVDGITSAYRLAEIVVQRLIRIGFFGVEHTNTLMSRHNSSLKRVRGSAVMLVLALDSDLVSNKFGIVPDAPDKGGTTT